MNLRDLSWRSDCGAIEEDEDVVDIEEEDGVRLRWEEDEVVVYVLLCLWCSWDLVMPFVVGRATWAPFACCWRFEEGEEGEDASKALRFKVLGGGFDSGVIFMAAVAFWLRSRRGVIVGDDVAEERLLGLLDCELSMSVALVGGDDASGEGFGGELSVRCLGEAFMVVLSDRGLLKAELGIKPPTVLTGAFEEGMVGFLEGTTAVDLGCWLGIDDLIIVFDFLVRSMEVLAPASSSSESSMTSDDLNLPFGGAFLFSFFVTSLLRISFTCFVASLRVVEFLS